MGNNLWLEAVWAEVLLTEMGALGDGATMLVSFPIILFAVDGVSFGIKVGFTGADFLCGAAIPPGKSGSKN